VSLTKGGEDSQLAQTRESERRGQHQAQGIKHQRKAGRSEQGEATPPGKRSPGRLGRPAKGDTPPQQMVHVRPQLLQTNWQRALPGGDIQ
jgi:hypothetical protein